MHVRVRLGGGLAQLAGNARIGITLQEGATVADLLENLRLQYPELEQKLPTAIAMVSGRHAGHDAALVSGQEVALLLPVAGGSH